ncbi:MAG: hypothetical protein RR367_10550 [Clostridia bacterium]
MSELDRLREGGVVGGGGAGFPLWKKLSTNAEVLLINGAECEPLLRSDQFLMLYEADTLVCAANRLRELVGAERVMICLKEHYHAQRKALEAAIAKKALPVCLSCRRFIRLATSKPWCAVPRGVLCRRAVCRARWAARWLAYPQRSTHGMRWRGRRLRIAW